MNSYNSYKPQVSTIKSDRVLEILALPRQPFDAHFEILAGYSSDLVRKISLETKLDELTICQYVGISRSTYYRKHLREKKAFTIEQSWKLYMFARMLDSSVFLFNGDISAALSWLKSPARALGDQAPLQMLSTPAGVDAVIELIGRVESGVIS